MEKYKASVFIGRFQPFHNGHKIIVEHGLEISDKVIIIIGSSNESRTIKNPFSFNERKQLILDEFPNHDNIFIMAQEDKFYDEKLWVNETTHKIKSHVKLTDSIALLGMYKDASSYYLNHFPFMEFVPCEKTISLDATTLRNSYFNEDIHLRKFVPDSTYGFLYDFYTTSEYTRLRDEYRAIENYKDQWKSSPYPPSFITADYVLSANSNHILLVKRKYGIGKGLIALPGGFVRNNETIKQAAIRELREETGIDISPERLDSIIYADKIFDYPSRSLRGRTVTQAFCGNINELYLPNVEGSDDAEIAFWMSYQEIWENRSKFFEDHFSIIMHFLIRK